MALVLILDEAKRRAPDLGELLTEVSGCLDTANAQQPLAPDRLSSAAYARMLRAAAEVFKEALRMGEPFEAWNERVHGCVLEVAAPALEWHHECGAVPRLTS